MDCYSRWKMPAPMARPSKSKKKEKPSSSAERTPSKEAEMQKVVRSLKEECSRLKLSEGHQKQRLEEQKAMMAQWTEEIQQQVDADQRRQAAEMNQMKEALEIREVMMSEYASMAMGTEYAEYKGYHDSEMYEYAKKRWEAQKERQQLEALQEEITRANQSAAATSISSDAEWDEAMVGTSPLSGSATRTRVKIRSSSKTRSSTAKPRKHGFD
jgi:hypothetical protein